ncbi:MAG: sigma-54-dependent Fis family transcriptional regulator [Proteobacteria bacterium]|nr:sigma-54-dependent Fis family transcriptional regulator [Pseudomonadota bacterium]
MPNSQPRILIVDDEAAVRDSLRRWFELDGYAIEVADSGAAALRRMQEVSFDVALIDLRMPGMDGVALQQRMHEVTPDTAVIIVTAFGTIQSAVEVLKHGAFDYLTKPVDPDELSRMVRRALELRELRAQNNRLRRAVDHRGGAVIVGETPAMRTLRAQVAEAASADVPVLICGETGTGKHLVATVLHTAGPRRYFSFVPLACGVSEGELGDDELLGQEGGSLPPTTLPRMGKLQLAEGGTLFLDEVARLGPQTQRALLELLRRGSFTPLGSTRPRATDFRLISASSVALAPLVQANRFSADLYYRVAVLTLTCPPLRERRADIPALARHLLERLSSPGGAPFTGFTPPALERLVGYDWPRNVRELANAIERALVVGRPPLIGAEDLLLGPVSAPPAAPLRETTTTTETTTTETTTTETTTDLSLAAVEQQHIAAVLERCQGDRRRAAALLGIAPALLDEKLALLKPHAAPG